MTLFESLKKEITTAHNQLRVALDARATATLPRRGATLDEIHRRLTYLEGTLAAWSLITNAVPLSALHQHPVVFDAALRKIIRDELSIDLAELHEAVEKA